MKQKIISILTEIIPDVDFSTENNMVDDGILDSFDLVSLIAELNEAFDVEIAASDIDADNFNSVEAIEEMINRLKQ